MAQCERCGNDYDKTFEVIMGGRSHAFDSFECAIRELRLWRRWEAANLKRWHGRLAREPKRKMRVPRQIMTLIIFLALLAIRRFLF